MQARETFWFYPVEENKVSQYCFYAATYYLQLLSIIRQYHTDIMSTRTKIFFIIIIYKCYFKVSLKDLKKYFVTCERYNYKTIKKKKHLSSKWCVYPKSSTYLFAVAYLCSLNVNNLPFDVSLIRISSAFRTTRLHI